MRNQIHSPYAGLPSRLLTTMLCFIFIMGLQNSTTAQQNSSWYLFNNDDLKNYSTEVFGGGQSRESVMAGTVFDANGNGKIHFMRFDDGPNAGVDEYPGLQVSVVYTDANADYYDERTADIAIKNNVSDRYFITALSRMNPGVSPNPLILYSDRIKVLEVNGNGQIQNEIKIYENTLTPGGGQYWGYGLYPTHSYYKANVVDNIAVPHDLLYICGYLTKENTTTTNYPNFLTSKLSFILTLDVTTSSWTVANWFCYDGTASIGATTNSPELDYDIAMRIQEITTGTYAGDIFLTGSLTEKTGIYNGPPYPYTCVRSATLSLQLDDWNLGNMGYNDNSFLDLGNGDGYGFNEFGVGMVEASSGTDKYIISTRYSQGSSCIGRAGDDWDNTYSFNDMLSGFFITNTDGSLVPSTTRLYYNQGWAVSTLPASGATGATSPARFLVAGMLQGAVPSCTHDKTINNDNITPFLFDADIDMVTGTITDLGGANGLVAYPNQSGTGDAGTVNNAYTNLGGGLSYIAWNPTFAARFSTSDDIVLNAPKWDNSANRLNLKTFFANSSTLALGTCIDQCTLSPSTPDIENAVGEDEVKSMDLLSSTTNGAYLVPDAFGGDCLGYVYGSVYKQGTTNIFPTERKGKNFVIYPNPANDKIHVKLANSVDIGSLVKIDLINMYGQNITSLFKGKASDLTSTNAIQLPAITSGIYTISISIDGRIADKQKITIQQ